MSEFIGHEIELDSLNKLFKQMYFYKKEKGEDMSLPYVNHEELNEIYNIYEYMTDFLQTKTHEQFKEDDKIVIFSEQLDKLLLQILFEIAENKILFKTKQLNNNTYATFKFIELFKKLNDYNLLDEHKYYLVSLDDLSQDRYDGNPMFTRQQIKKIIFLVKQSLKKIFS